MTICSNGDESAIWSSYIRLCATFASVDHVFSMLGTSNECKDQKEQTRVIDKYWLLQQQTYLPIVLRPWINVCQCLYSVYYYCCTYPQFSRREATRTKTTICNNHLEDAWQQLLYYFRQVEGIMGPQLMHVRGLKLTPGLTWAQLPKIAKNGTKSHNC